MSKPWETLRLKPRFQATNQTHPLLKRTLGGYRLKGVLGCPLMSQVALYGTIQRPKHCTKGCFYGHGVSPLGYRAAILTPHLARWSKFRVVKRGNGNKIDPLLL